MKGQKARKEKKNTQDYSLFSGIAELQGAWVHVDLSIFSF